MVYSDSVSVEAVEKIQRDWQKAEIKTKLQAKKMTRLDFDKLRPSQRSEYIRAGGKVTD